MEKDKYLELSSEEQEKLQNLYHNMKEIKDTSTSIAFDSVEFLNECDRAEAAFYREYDRLLGKDYPFFDRHFDDDYPL